MNIIQVVSGIGAEAAGPSYSVPRLCESLGARGARVELHVLTPEPATQPEGYLRFGHEASPWVRRLGISRDMRLALVNAAGRSDILHNHGLWMMPNVYAELATRRNRCLLMISPRGTLSSWAMQRSRWVKKLFWMFGQNKALHNAACIHATAVSEYNEIRNLGIKAPVAIIPNGIDIPELQKRTDTGARYKRLFFLGRIHPIKGVDVLLRSWARVQDAFPDWELVIAGPDNGGYLGEMEKLAKNLGGKRVSFSGPIYGIDKENAYQSSDLFVLPTHSENFGMTVAEALSNGTPVMVSKGAPWPGIEEHGCGWWIDRGEEALVKCLRQALGVAPDELSAMGLRGRQWMQVEFSWDRIAVMMLQTYAWMLGEAEMPDWVIKD